MTVAVDDCVRVTACDIDDPTLGVMEPVPRCVLVLVAVWETDAAWEADGEKDSGAANVAEDETVKCCERVPVTEAVGKACVILGVTLIDGM